MGRTKYEHIITRPEGQEKNCLGELAAAERFHCGYKAGFRVQGGQAFRPSLQFITVDQAGWSRPFRPAVKAAITYRLQPLRCSLTIPHRGLTSESTYFVTTNVFERRMLFQVDKIARLFIEVLLHYRTAKKYLLHEFVVMPDHFHVIVSPTGITLERAMQFIKGGFSFRLNQGLKLKRVVWQTSFVDRRIRDSLEYERFQDYIWQNPVKRFLAKTPQEYPYSSANPAFQLDPVPQRLKPIVGAAKPQA